MKTTDILAIAALGLSLASCAPRSGMTVQQLSVMSSPATQIAPLGKMQVQVAIKERWKAEKPLGTKPLTTGKKVTLGETQEFIYPTAYELGTVNSGSDQVTPATPTNFKMINTGITTNLTSKPANGGMVLLEGSVSVTEFQGFSRMGGKGGRQILDEKGRVITENRIEMPKFSTYTTPVFVLVKPGETEVVEINHPKKGTKMTLFVDPVPGNEVR